MKKYKRIFVIVMDSLGIGAADDAAAYGDAGTDTLGHIAERREKFVIPNLQKIGMANLHPLKQVAPVEHPLGYYMEDEGAQCREGYDDRALGADGSLHAEALSDLYRAWLPAGADRMSWRNAPGTRLSEIKVRAALRLLMSLGKRRLRPGI